MAFPGEFNDSSSLCVVGVPVVPTPALSSTCNLRTPSATRGWSGALMGSEPRQRALWGACTAAPPSGRKWNNGSAEWSLRNGPLICTYILYGNWQCQKLKKDTWMSASICYCFGIYPLPHGTTCKMICPENPNHCRLRKSYIRPHHILPAAIKPVAHSGS